MTKKKVFNITNCAEFLLGLLFISVAFNVFIMKNNIVYGMSGIGVMLKSLIGIDPSIVIFVGTVILLILSFILLGYKKTKNTIIGSLLYPIFIKITEPLSGMIDVSQLDVTISILCGAVLNGIGLGMVFKAGFTTGGTDILNDIISKYAKVGVSKSMLMTNGVIILCSICVFGITSAIYSIITLYIISVMSDKVLLGISQSKAFYIITEQENSVKKYVLSHLLHGVTILEARGGYTGNNQKVIMCIIPTREYHAFKEEILKIDPGAFFLVTDAYEVSGGA